jgi:hypothetical protein
MDAQLKRDWVKALRSGNYKQGRGRLCSVNGRYCCLGVLYDQLPDKEWVRTTTVIKENVWAIPVQFGDQELLDYNILPLDIMAEVGMSHAFQQRLTDMNDVEKLNFDQIADWIEEQL